MHPDPHAMTLDPMQGKMNRCLLWVEEGKAPGESFVIEEGTAIVGRSALANLYLGDPYVSRQHLRIIRQGDKVTVECLSRFGAAIDGVSLKAPTVVRSGQRISLSADTVLRFEVDSMDVRDEEGSTETATGTETPMRSMKPPAATQARFSLGALIMRFQRQLVAFVATVTILLAVKMLLPSTAYLYQFLLTRSACQWVSLYAFMFGVACLLRRWGHFLKERRMLDLLRARRTETAGSGTVWKRFHRIQYYATRMDPPELRTLAKDLSERDADELRVAYTPVHDVIQILPLIGFLGNVLGLSLGLNASFSKTGGTSFISSIGTAFDTTLLALACTIALMVLQRLVHRQEETLLGNLNEYVETYVEDWLPEKELPDLDSGRMLGELRTALNCLCQQVGEKMGQTIADHGQVAIETLQSQMSGFRISMQGVQEDLVKNAAAFEDGMKEQALRVADALGVAAREALAASFSALRADIASACAQPSLDKYEARFVTAVSDIVAALRQDLQGLQSALVDAGRENSRAYLQTCVSLDEHLRSMREQILALQPAASTDRDLVVRALRESVMELCHHMEKVLKQPRRVSIVDVVEPESRPGIEKG